MTALERVESPDDIYAFATWCLISRLTSVEYLELKSFIFGGV